MDVQRINPPGVHRPGGYTHVVRVGETVYVSGQVALAPDGALVGPGDGAAQAEQVFRNLAACLAAAGAGPGDVVKTTTYVTRAEDVVAVRDARARWFPQDPPASTMVVVSRLARPELLVEVEAVAVVGRA